MYHEVEFNMKKIKIKVIGSALTGKSTVARLISNHLSELGLITSIADEPKVFKDDYNLSSKLDKLIEREVTVEIETVQVRRDGSFRIEG
jgi:pantothenate kinase-related protein Tda10